MTTALSVEPDINLQDLLEVNANTNWSVQFQPFLKGPGGRVGGTIIRRAVPWKGRGMDYLEENHPEVAAGLQQAQQMAMQTEGSEGVRVIDDGSGPRPVPISAAELAEAGQGSITVWDETYDNVGQATRAIENRGGGRGHLPSAW